MKSFSRRSTSSCPPSSVGFSPKREELRHEAALHSVSLAVAFTLITAAHIVLGELAPKSLVILRPERTTLVVAAPLRLFYYVFFPFIWVLNQLARLLLRAFGLSVTEQSEEHDHTEAELRLLLGRSKVLSPGRLRRDRDDDPRRQPAGR